MAKPRTWDEQTWERMARNMGCQEQKDTTWWFVTTLWHFWWFVRKLDNLLEQNAGTASISIHQSSINLVVTRQTFWHVQFQCAHGCSVRTVLDSIECQVLKVVAPRLLFGDTHWWCWYDFLRTVVPSSQNSHRTSDGPRSWGAVTGWALSRVLAVGHRWASCLPGEISLKKQCMLYSCSASSSNSCFYDTLISVVRCCKCLQAFNQLSGIRWMLLEYLRCCLPGNLPLILAASFRFRIFRFFELRKK